MSSTLYRKYRPQKFSEIIGQQHIVQTLSNAVKNNRIGQAYLFTGPRGTGKTTLARVFAKAVSCQKRNGFEPCQKCEICKNITEGRSLDIIEIDAASNTGVDNIRELRETVKLPPTQGKFKIYIIDEVHMLSMGAFNALLKTLEEPPAHVIFILATTEIHKVPETIISRCQRFDFSRLSLEQIVRKLSSIADTEGVKIEKDALEMIAIAAEGGMRDAESILAQIISLEDKNITASEVEEILGTARHESIKKLVDLILENETGQALTLINKISSEGANLEIFHKSLLNYLRQLMVVTVSQDLTKLFSLELTSEQIEKIKNQTLVTDTKQVLSIISCFLEVQQNVRSSFIPQLPLEMAIVKSTQINDSEVQASAKLKSGGKPDKSRIIDRSADKEEKKILENKSEIKNVGNFSINDVARNWDKILEATQPYNHSLLAFLSNCEPVKIEDGKIIIATKYNIYKDKLNEQNNRTIIEDIIGKILNSKAFVRFITEEEAGIKIKSRSVDYKSEGEEKKENGSLLDDAMRLMGGKIVEE